MHEVARALYTRLARRSHPAPVMRDLATAYGTFKARAGLSMGELVQEFAALRSDLSEGGGDGDRTAEIPGAIDDSLAMCAHAFAAERERMHKAAFADLAHRMRERLNVISLVAEILRDASEEASNGNAEILLRQIEDFEPLLAELRTSTAPPVCVMATMDLRRLCREAVDGAVNRGARIELVTNSLQTIRVRADPFRMRETIGQLVRQKETPNANVVVRLRAAGKEAMLEVFSDVEDVAGAHADLEDELAWLLATQSAEAHGGTLVEHAQHVLLTLPLYDPAGPSTP